MGKRQPPTGQWVTILKNENSGQGRWERKEEKRLKELKRKKQFTGRIKKQHSYKAKKKKK
jgi:hypothetical protein